MTQPWTQHSAKLWLRHWAGLQLSAASKAATVWARNPGQVWEAGSGQEKQRCLETSPEIIQGQYPIACQNPWSTETYSVLSLRQTSGLLGAGSRKPDWQVWVAAGLPALLTHRWAEQGWETG